MSTTTNHDLLSSREMALRLADRLTQAAHHLEVARQLGRRYDMAPRCTADALEAIKADLAWLKTFDGPGPAR